MARLVKVDEELVMKVRMKFRFEVKMKLRMKVRVMEVTLPLPFLPNTCSSCFSSFASIKAAFPDLHPVDPSKDVMSLQQHAVTVFLLKLYIF